MAVDIGTAIWSRHYNPNKISYAAHFAGMIAGQDLDYDGGGDDDDDLCKIC